MEGMTPIWGYKCVTAIKRGRISCQPQATDVTILKYAKLQTYIVYPYCHVYQITTIMVFSRENSYLLLYC